MQWSRLRIWWKTQVLGVPAKTLLQNAMRERDWARASAIQDVTGVTIQDPVDFLE